jgi:hypothetical protein
MSAVVAIAAGVSGTAPAFAELPIQAKTDKAPVNVIEVDAEHSPDVVAAARLAPETDQHDHGWELRATFRIRNHGKAQVTLTGMTVDTDVTTPTEAPVMDQDAEKNPIPFVIAAGKDRRVHMPVTLSNDAPPAPTKLGVKLHFDGYKTPTMVQRAVALDENHSASGGYRFPARSEDLPAGTYWSTGGGFHANTRSQRYAYDLGAVAYNTTEDAWRGRKPGPDGKELDTSKNENWWIFGLPVYAMNDGTVLACRRSVAENVPGVLGDAGGNGFWIDHGNGEVAPYAHFQQGSVPASLCPVESDGSLNAQPIKVKAGDKLGLVGNSGSSSAPHLHIHVQDAPPADWAATGNAEGVPLNFHHATVRVRTGFDPEAEGDQHWEHLHEAEPAALGTSLLIIPNPCGWIQYPTGAREVAHHGVSAGCWQDTVDAVVAAGYKMVFLDAFAVNGSTYFNGVFRPADGTPWAAAHGLTSAAYQAAVEAHKAQGRRLLLAESYLTAGGVRYAAVFGTGNGPWTAYHGRTQAQHQAEFNALKAQGYHPRSVSVVSVGGQRLYTAVYDKSNVGSWVLDSTVALADYQGTFDAQAAAGRKLAHLNAYEHDGQVWVSALFWSAGPSVTALHGLTSAEYQDAWDANMSAGRSTRLVTGYEGGRAARYAAAWELPGAHTGPVMPGLAATPK